MTASLLFGLVNIWWINGLGSYYQESTPCSCSSRYLCQFFEIFLENLSLFDSLFSNPIALMYEFVCVCACVCVCVCVCVCTCVRACMRACVCNDVSGSVPVWYWGKLSLTTEQTPASLTTEQTPASLTTEQTPASLTH